MAVYSLLTGYHVLSPERLRKEPVTAVAAMQHLARYSRALACVPASLIPEWVPKVSLELLCPGFTHHNTDRERWCFPSTDDEPLGSS